ncbi:hypothetical protein JYK02_12885 [Corallococcus macrosporus]|uniref:Uncharacterized protein n=1 Tax=Corallococcus macrosporus TaxID=35 RepID=A0ABS3D9N8_9BACT|nr:hypothetical protein [Corallococcus macrosporus]MBN8228398.1 hypothetical protein [Corallococcus macrosporus]
MIGFFVLAAVLALPGIAHAQTVVGLYPIQGKLEPGPRADAEGLIVSGVRASERRFGAFILRGPVPLKASCDPTPTTECLAGLNRGGATLFAEGAMGADGVVTVTLTAIRGAQRTRPISFRFIPGFLDLRPAHFAVDQLEKAFAELGTPLADSAAPRTEAPVAQAPVADAAPSEADPVSLTSGSPYEDDAPAPTSSGWMRKTGIYASIGGAVLVGAGGVFGLRSRSLNNDLSTRYTEGRLVPGDRSRFDRAKTSSTLANTLMIGGGVIALTGLTFWGLSAVSFDSDGRGGGKLNVGGRF